MQGSITPLSTLGPEADDERQRIREKFEAGVGARETLAALCELADRNIQRIFGEVLRGHGDDTQGLSLLALGGFGRRWLSLTPIWIFYFYLATKERKRNSDR